MPPRHHHPRHHVPLSSISALIKPDQLDTLLKPWIPLDEDRAFVLRCVLQEGPHHHRGANYVLLRLLGEVLAALGVKEVAPQGEGVEVPMRLPPHLMDHAQDAAFPVRLPTSVLERLEPRDSPAFAAMVDCLTDGPPQHALANVLMTALLGAVLAHVEKQEPTP